MATPVRFSIVLVSSAPQEALSRTPPFRPARAQATVPALLLKPTAGPGAGPGPSGPEAGAPGRVWLVGGSGGPPAPCAGVLKPLPLLTGCCRTTSWEGSPPRPCGSCRACTPCESPAARPVSLTARGSCLWLPWDLLSPECDVHSRVCVRGSWAPGPAERRGDGTPLDEATRAAVPGCLVSCPSAWGRGGDGRPPKCQTAPALRASGGGSHTHFLCLGWDWLGLNWPPMCDAASSKEPATPLPSRRGIVGAGLSAGLGKRAGCRVADTASRPGPGDTVAPTLAEPTEFSCTSMSGGTVRRYLERHHSWETGLGITLIQWGNRGTVSMQYVRTKPLSLRVPPWPCRPWVWRQR